MQFVKLLMQPCCHLPFSAAFSPGECVQVRELGRHLPALDVKLSTKYLLNNELVNKFHKRVFVKNTTKKTQTKPQFHTHTPPQKNLQSILLSFVDANLVFRVFGIPCDYLLWQFAIHTLFIMEVSVG